jgi:anthranilate synthase
MTMRILRYQTRSGIAVSRTTSGTSFRRGLRHLLRKLDRYRGFYLSSGYEYPGRYSRWDIAAIHPALEIVAAGRDVEFRPLNGRGDVLCRLLHPVLAAQSFWDDIQMRDAGAFHGRLKPMEGLFAEEERSKQPSPFSVLRALVEEFRHPDDSRLALVGAFGYDLLFQFDPIQLKLPRGARKDLHLFFCDEIYFMDRKKEQIERFQYDFTRGELTTVDLPRVSPAVQRPKKRAPSPIASDHTREEYMAKVETVRAGMKRGDYYEVVLRQTFRTSYSESPSKLFETIQESSPSPYEFILQFGDEQLVGASPEMFVRVEGPRVETCPISGTARRTGDPMIDAENIKRLLASAKEESELTMCTDVDRNDKSRVCVPGSVRIIGRRLIESYAGLFHTVDHVEGLLKPGFDALDAFLSHMWAVTLIGAPKKAASQAVEDLEKDARGWYGGAVGMVSLHGDINTGITIRTVHLRDGIASYPAGATLLYDSDPAAEEEETRIKATGFFRAMAGRGKTPEEGKPAPVGQGLKMLLVDNDDCFIQTLANYVRQTGAEVVTYRWGIPESLIEQINPDLILVSPGPGRPSDFGVPQLVRYAARAGYPVFGVCLGLQGMVEAFGGELGVLPYPMHGKPSRIRHRNTGIFEGLPESFQVGRYHSLYAKPDRLPDVLEVTANSEDGIIMGVRHRELPIEAVQFHPESLLSLESNIGLRLMENVIRIHGTARSRTCVAE